MKGKSSRLSMILIGALLVSVLMVSPFMLAFAAEKPIVIKYSDHDPPGGLRTDFVKEVWLNEIEKQTNGRVKIRDYWGGALLTAPEALKGIGDGVTQMGFIYPDFFPKRLVSFQIFKLFPRAPSKWENISWIYRIVYDQIPAFKAEFEEKWNQKLLLVTSALPGAFCSSKPITSIDDLKGNKWRCSSRWQLEMLKNVGAIPVSVPWADCYMALQTGTIDGVFTNYDGINMMRFDEVAPNILIGEQLWWASPFMHTVNLDFWNSLPEDIQEGILKATRIAEEAFGKPFSAKLDQIVAAEKKIGCKVTFMSDEDVEKWENKPKLEKLQEKWVKEAKAEGLENAAWIMERMKMIIQEGIEREQ